jgi:hypothetical protein
MTESCGGAYTWTALKPEIVWACAGSSAVHVHAGTSIGCFIMHLPLVLRAVVTSYTPFADALN